LSGENHNQLWVQVGCAHGFLVPCDSADFLSTHNYAAQDEQ
jgi:dTDP-4-dehydrorhamnose 3,5-epimerase-like enzyme